MSYNLESTINDFLAGSIATVGRAPVVTPLNVTANGTYNPPSDVDGFKPVTVNVPAPVLTALNATENKVYTPPSGVDGYNSVAVNVPIPTFNTESLTVSSNGTYTPSSGVDGFDEVNVQVPAPTLTSLSVSSNGTYTPSSGIDGYNSVSVNVTPSLTTLTATDNGTYTPPTGYDGFSSVTFNYSPTITWILNNTYIGQTDYMQYFYQYNFDQPITSGMYIFQLKTTANNIISAPVGIYFDGSIEARAVCYFPSYGYYTIRLLRTHFFFSYDSGDYIGGQVYCKMSTIDITGHTY